MVKNFIFYSQTSINYFFINLNDKYYTQFKLSKLPKFEIFEILFYNKFHILIKKRSKLTIKKIDRKIFKSTMNGS